MPRKHHALWPVVGLLAALSAATAGELVSRTKPASAILTGEVPLAFDYALTTYLVESGRRFVRNVGSAWGYDPYFGAGYPSAYLEDNFPLLQLVAAALSAVPAGTILLGSNLVMLAAMPWLLYGSIRSFGASPRACALATVLGITALRVGEFALFPVTGSVSGGFVQVLALATAAAAHRTLRSPSAGRVLILCLLVTFSLPIHKSAVLLLPPVFLALLVMRDRERDMPLRPALALYGVLALVTAATNWFWIAPMLRHLPVRGSVPPPSGRASIR